MQFLLASMLVGAALGMGGGGARMASFGDAGWVVIAHDPMLGEGSVITAMFDSSKFGGAEAGDNDGPATAITWAQCITGPFKYHIHTKAGTAGFTADACSSDNFGAHFDPTGVADETCDQPPTGEWVANCEVGDFSGKAGLWGVAASSKQWWDATVTKTQLEKVEDGTGANSIVVHCTDGSRAMCAPLVDIPAEDMATDFTADFGAVGSVTISEAALTVELDASALAGDGPTDAMTWAECWDTAGAGADGIKYHIHTNVNSETSVATNGPTGVAVGAGCAGTIAGGHFKGPGFVGDYGCENDSDTTEGDCTTASSVWHKCDYPSATQFTTWMAADTRDVGAMLAAVNETPASACEMGDLSGKFGKYAIATGAKFTETMPMLGGDFENMSIVFHCADGSRAFCTNMALTPAPESSEELPAGAESVVDESPAAIYSAALAMLVALLW